MSINAKTISGLLYTLSHQIGTVTHNPLGAPKLVFRDTSDELIYSFYSNDIFPIIAHHLGDRLYGIYSIITLLNITKYLEVYVMFPDMIPQELIDTWENEKPSMLTTSLAQEYRKRVEKFRERINDMGKSREFIISPK